MSTQWILVLATIIAAPLVYRRFLQIGDLKAKSIFADNEEDANAYERQTLWIERVLVRQFAKFLFYGEAFVAALKGDFQFIPRNRFLMRVTIEKMKETMRKQNARRAEFEQNVAAGHAELNEKLLH